MVPGIVQVTASIIYLSIYISYFVSIFKVLFLIQLVGAMLSSMSRQMNEVHGGSALGATSDLAEVWDSVQMTVRFSR